MKVLLVDNDEPVLGKFAERLRRWKYEVDTCSSEAQARDFIESRGDEIDIALLDMKMESDESGLVLITLLHRLHPHVASIVFTDYDDVLNAAKCMESGAFSYIPKEYAHEVLQPTLLRAEQRVLGLRRLGKRVAALDRMSEKVNKLEQDLQTLRSMLDQHTAWLSGLATDIPPRDVENES